MSKVTKARGAGEMVWVSMVAGAILAAAGAIATVPTTALDFFAPGTQPGPLTHPLVSAQSCANCHGYYSNEHEPYALWSASMMGQAARDPIFYAALTVANQDAAFAGEMCLRCHTPGAFVAGRTADPTGNLLTDSDFEGVSCSICHRMVDPVYRPGISPPEDESLLAEFEYPVVVPGYPEYTRHGNASLVLDKLDRRRGPLPDPEAPHAFLYSPLHLTGNHCAACHDVSNPVYSKQPDGSYVANTLNTPHPTGGKYEQFPIERTYSEWAQSAFAQAPIDMGSRYGGISPMVSSCQDCHMPKIPGTACDPQFNPPQRQMPRHAFAGGNTWVLRSIHGLYPEYETGLTNETVDDAIARTQAMLAAASDLELIQDGNLLTTRVINQSGHKLPTGYPEGRRMWVNVKFYDAQDVLIAERGHYDDASAVLTGHDTKVYEAKLGLDAHASALSGKPAGESFHFALNNTWLKDNRIPPRGFTNAAFASVQSAPVAYTYADGQYWDDTEYWIPTTATRAEVRVLFQTTTKEYIEFLRDANVTDTRGQVAYDQWVLHGKSAPALLDLGTIDLSNRCPADFNNSGGTPDDADVAEFFAAWSEGNERADFNASGGTPDDADVALFFDRWNEGC
ncbi:MAG: hypothetical protein HUU18_04925 [Phycisphaerales bacterium]|nr:hypothetical protein [Phycisphaerales bacterium]